MGSEATAAIKPAVSPVQDSLPVVRVTQRVWVRRCAEGTATECRASLGNRWPEAKGVASHHPSVLPIVLR